MFPTYSLNDLLVEFSVLLSDNKTCKIQRMFFANRPISAIVSIPKRDKVEYLEMKAELFQWAQEHKDNIVGRYVLNSNKILVIAKIYCEIITS